VDRGSGDSTRLGSEGFEATRRKFRALRRLSEQARANAQVLRAKVREGRSQREILHDSAFARLQAKQGTLAVIEQAKGVVMAQQQCGPEEAFDLLRRVSQRTNIKLYLLAAQIVENVTSGDNDDNVRPISVGAARYVRGGTRPQPPAG
jgi:hypothetical protein